MADPVITAIHRVRIRGVNHAGENVNVLHFGQTVNIFDDPDARATFLTQLAEALRDCVLTTLLPALSTDYNFDRITAQQIFPVASDVIEVAPLAAAAGELGSSSPGFVSQVIRVKTGMGGRRARGRISLPPPPEEGVTQSTLTPGQIGLIIAFATCLAGKFIGTGRTFAGATLGVFSRTTQQAGGSLNDWFTAATSLSVSQDVGSMNTRKRLRGS